MKANTDKSHFLITSNEEKYFVMCGETMQNGKKENLLQVSIDNKLRFTEDVKEIRDKAIQFYYLTIFF